MYERSYGYKYQEPAQYASAAEIAKLIRADIKQAKAEGLLPTQWKYSVRSENFSGGCSIDVRVTTQGEAWIREDFGRCPVDARNGQSMCGNGMHYYNGCPGAAHLTEEGEAALMTLKRIHGAYNHDGSEVQVDYFDVRYYGVAEFVWDDARGPLARER